MINTPEGAKLIIGNKDEGGVKSILKPKSDNKSGTN
jgi:hypothetical protein